MISNAALSRFRSMKVPMPAITLHELIEGVLPAGAFLVSGQPDSRVRWARTLAATAGANVNAVEGDLILISMEALQQNMDPERDLARIIGQLVPSRIRAIAVQGKLNIAALEAAIRNEMAVIYLPEDTAVNTVERAVIRYIMDLQAEIEREDAALQQELARQANGNFGLPAICQTLARTIGLPTTLHDARGFRLAHSLPPIDHALLDPWQQHLAILQDQELVAHFTDQSITSHHNTTIMESNRSLSAAITVDSTVVGYLSLVKLNAPLKHFAPIALSRGATVCGLLMAKSYALRNDTSGRTDWISAWLDGEPSDDPILTARAEQSMFDPEQVYVISTMRWTPGPDLRRTTKPVKPEQLTEQIRHETKQRRIQAIIGQYHDRTLLFLALERAQHTGRMKQYTVSIAKRMTEILGGTVICGVGRPGVGLTELRRSFHEAERAMNLSTQLWQEPHTVFFGDLSLTELLMNIQDHEQLKQFCQEWLYHILDYDQQNNSDLLLTMSVYFANNGNMAATAKQLNVHRNTLVYRLNRIAEITQLDMDDADVQLNLHLAIKAYRLLQQLEHQSTTPS
ncbi:MAG: hypothetical protein GYB66_09215 [Chloroflexi bacterium]|nr:hypothetical protein [Chloroflexota bacterium]